MSGRVSRSSAAVRTALIEGWECASAPPGEPPEMVGGAPAGLDWLPALVPGTAAASLLAARVWSLDSPPRDFDAEDWWFRLRFPAVLAATGERVVLGCDGLATFADVWLNGETLGATDNMFTEHRWDVGALLMPRNELIIRFAALESRLRSRRGRPRWRAPMVKNQHLRWVRTTLLGRTPGWSPPAAAVGPWRPVWLERCRRIELIDVRLGACVRTGLSSPAQPTPVVGVVSVSFEALPLSGTIDSVDLLAERNGQCFEASLPLPLPGHRMSGELSIDAVDLWWPHTHGNSALYQIRLRIVVRNDDATGGSSVVEIELGRLGFRTLRLNRDGGDFSLTVNGVDVFCRGACWTPLDCVSLQASGAEYRAALQAVRDAGMNMLRLAGALVYETDEFLDLCDEMGILLWQDLMFANMDYPADDKEFHASVMLEVGQQLSRLQARPALAVLCGNSEGAQQAAMSGAARAQWAPPLFETDFAALSQEYESGVPYCASSAIGGAFPHQPATGAASYYGVGAYLLPLSDARRSGVRFASECLAFANVPENETLELLARGAALRCHHPRWKERVPRDQGAGWDFDDVRDHYLADLYRLSPMRLRYADHERYLRFGRAVSGEVMSSCFAEWRRPRSACAGALVWFLRDFWPGSGWGVFDSSGVPKAAYYYLKRVLQPCAMFLSDEGTNGLVLYVTNERPEAVRTVLQLRLFRHSEPVGTVLERTLDLVPGRTLELPVTDLFEGFVDLSYAFRFGPASYDVLHARLVDPGIGTVRTEAFHFAQGLPNALDGNLGLSARAAAVAEGAYELRIECAKFAQSVHVEAPGFIADDQYFHMAPKSVRTLKLRPRTPAAAAVRPEATLHALNSAAACRVGFDR